MHFQPDIQLLQALHQQHFDLLFALAFVHTGAKKSAKELVQKLFLYMVARPKMLSRAEKDSTFLLPLANNFCQRFYQEKLRRKTKASQFDPAKLPFPAERLLPVLRLPASSKSPLVLASFGFSVEQISAALGLSVPKIEKSLQVAYRHLSMEGHNVTPLVTAIALSEETRRREFDKITVAVTARGFRSLQQLKSVKRRLDDSAIYIAVAIVAFCLIAYFGVQYGWFA